MKTITLRLEEDLLLWADAAASAAGINRTEYIKVCISEKIGLKPVSASRRAESLNEVRRMHAVGCKCMVCR